jgi:hypothetical protein
MSTENQIHDGAVVEEERRPLLDHDFDSSILILTENGDNTIFPPLPSSAPNQRLVSLDVFRGLTVAVRPLFLII